MAVVETGSHVLHPPESWQEWDRDPPSTPIRPYIKQLARTRRFGAGRRAGSADGRPLEEWSEPALRRRMSILFQDFNQYKLQVGHNIGAGDVPRFDDEAGWRRAAERALADATLVATSFYAGMATSRTA